jgi:site-specific recombinase XerD
VSDSRLPDKRADLVRTIARQIASDSPHLADLGQAELEKLARVVVAEGLKDELKGAVTREKIPYAEERERFLDRASRSGSVHTRKAYMAGIARLEAYCEEGGYAPLEITPGVADDWIESEKAQGRAPATVRLWVSGASAFWTWLERRHTELANPFRGTRARPSPKPARRLAVPSDVEIRELEAAADPLLKAAIVMMSQAGLRVGGLPSLSISGDRWRATTKGKEHSGRLPAEARAAFRRAGLPLRSPFASLSAEKLRLRLVYLVAKLHKEGKLKESYSAHDLRHSYAVRLYQATHDVYRVEKALGHSSVAVTEGYLRSLGLDDSSP